MKQCTAPRYSLAVRGKVPARCRRTAVWHGLCSQHALEWRRLMQGLRRLMEQERAEHLARGGV